MAHSSKAAYARSGTVEIPRYGNEILFAIGCLFWLVGDLYTTHMALNVGAVESNSLARQILTLYGFDILVIGKLLSVVLFFVHWRLLRTVAIWIRSASHENPVYLQICLWMFTWGYPTGVLALGVTLTLNNSLVYLQLTGVSF